MNTLNVNIKIDLDRKMRSMNDWILNFSTAEQSLVGALYALAPNAHRPSTAAADPRSI